uniref:Uncharacterized protein n=1 Tax=Oryza rufipogon TaxID=4529 RepID=A0A0E0Q2M8_ORYRU
MPAAKKITLLQTVAFAGVFSAVSCWYGFMFGRESARRELGGIIEDLRSSGGNQTGMNPRMGLPPMKNPQMSLS